MVALTYFIGFSWKLNEIIFVKCSVACLTQRKTPINGSTRRVFIPFVLTKGEELLFYLTEGMLERGTHLIFLFPLSPAAQSDRLSSWWDQKRGTGQGHPRPFGVTLLLNTHPQESQLLPLVPGEVPYVEEASLSLTARQVHLKVRNKKKPPMAEGPSCSR